MMLIGMLIGSLMLSCLDSLYIQNVQTFQYFGKSVAGKVIAAEKNAVAFSAILSKSITVGGKEVVKYDSLLTNVGGAYDKSTGVFTAPYKGIYTISCSLLSSTSNYVHLDIMKNGKKISIVYSASGTNPHSAQTLQLLLKKGDNIWIQNHSENKASLHDHGSYNLFSGVLITQI
ncbi:complement C1q tumor necrosis factor-related protein 4-like [Crassostrea angulata]|uniref:complement C1q tumor necrosis factor-related protein 4-like n=1 Tax=Magallana angulata TaxID=2784310 RepID=UPI0022B1A80D|nr:complement C1q tumor necrosis factor-related protein 4-like [Crassostrea angulata]